MNFFSSLYGRYCSRKCLSPTNLTIERILQIRKQFCDRGSEGDVTTWLANFLASSKKEDGHPLYHFGDGQPVCFRAFMRMSASLSCSECV